MVVPNFPQLIYTNRDIDNYSLRAYKYKFLNDQTNVENTIFIKPLKYHFI